MTYIRPLISRCFQRQNAGILVFVVLFIATFIVWMSLDAYQSHFIAGLRTLGDTTTKSIIGVPKEGRGDEWSTYLPILKQAYLEGFPEHSSLKPYFEKLDWFIAIPHFNSSLIFLPNYILYWIVPGGLALSFQGFYYNAIFIISVVWLLANLGVGKRYALACAFMLLCSQFYQVWWTSNFPALGAGILPFAVFTSRIRNPYKLLLLAWCLGHMLFGEMYPPFLISTALAVIPLILAARPDLLNRKDISVAILAAGIALTSYLILNWDFFQLVSHTSYPGARVNTGGGSTVRSILGLVFPTLPTNGGGGLLQNLYALAVGGTVLPLLFLSLLPQIEWNRRAVRLSVVFMCIAVCCVWYMLVGVPREVALLTGLYLVPGPRMALGLSLLVAFYSITMISWNAEAFKPTALVVVLVLYICVSLVDSPSAYLVKNFFAIKYYAWVFVVLGLAAILTYYGFSSNQRRSRIAISVILLGMAATHIMIYGSFNPIMHADDILRPVHSQVVNDWLALYKKNGDKSFGTIGNYGHLLRGENLPALEAIHLANVKPEIYSQVFPSLSRSQISEMFNQFRGIAFANILKINASGATVVFPIRPYGVSFFNILDDKSVHEDVRSLSTGVTVVGSSSRGPDTFLVRWNATLSKPLPIGDVLVLHLDCPASDSWVTRYPVVLPGHPIVPVALQGVAGQISVSSPSGAVAERCVSRLWITAAHRTQQASDGSSRIPTEGRFPKIAEKERGARQAPPTL